MKKLRQTCVVLALISPLLFSDAYGHQQYVHQYLTVEGFNLLQAQIGGNIPAMQNHLGGLGSEFFGDRSWRKNYVTTGAWREDAEDVMYWYSRTNPPTITGLSGVLYETFITLFGGPPGDDAFVSSTHFFDADNGDAISTDMEGTYGGLHWLFTVPNAYQKLQKYAYPYRSWIMKYYDGSACALPLC